MKKELIEALIDELKENFEGLDLKSSFQIKEKKCEDLSMRLLLPEDWQKVRWAVDVFSRYGLPNTQENALRLTECGLRSLAKIILEEGKYPAKVDQHPSIH